MDYKILRDGVEVAQVTDWPEKFYPDGGLTKAFSLWLTAWVVRFEPGTYQFHYWEAISL